MIPLLQSAPVWTPPRSERLNLWHGCLKQDADSIQKHGVDPSKGRANTDFGQGFYTTTIRHQAEQWAFFRASRVKHKSPTTKPFLLRFTVRRETIAELNSLAFVNGDYNSEDYWSFVQHCRQSPVPGIQNHLHPDSSRSGWYDMVTGPVAAFWSQRVAMDDADQFSFHTRPAVVPLNDAIQNAPRDFEMIAVT